MKKKKNWDEKRGVSARGGWSPSNLMPCMQMGGFASCTFKLVGGSRSLLCGMGCPPPRLLHLLFLFSNVLYCCFWFICFPWIWVGFTLATVESQQDPTMVSGWNWAKLRSQVYLAESWGFEAKIMKTTRVFPLFPSIFLFVVTSK